MNEPKPFASLSSGLLARKGNAKPAMRPHGFGQVGMGLDDLGWNDMGHGPDPEDGGPEHVPSSIAALTPAPRIVEHHDGESDYVDEAPAPAVHDQQREIAEHFGAEPQTEEVAEEDFDRPVLAVKQKPQPFDWFNEDEADAKAVEAADEVAEPVAHVADPVAEIVEPAPVVAEPVAAPKGPSKVVMPKIAARSQGKKAAFTLRLDAERHLRLRVACALTNRSAQNLVSEALEAYLAAIPGLDAIPADKAN